MKRFLCAWAASVAAIEIVDRVGGLDLSIAGNLALAFLVGIAYGLIEQIQKART